MDFETLVRITKSFSLVWFFSLFAVVLFRTFRKKNKETLEACRYFALKDEQQ